MISENFKEILDNYGQIKENEDYVQNPFASKIRKQFTYEIRDFVKEVVEDKELYHIKGNAGRWTNWANNANIRIGNYNSCPSFRYGLYLFYFFESDGSGVYLSLDQGNDMPKDNIRLEIANKLGELIDSNIPDGFVMEYSEGKLHMLLYPSFINMMN